MRMYTDVDKVINWIMGYYGMWLKEMMINYKDGYLTG